MRMLRTRLYADPRARFVHDVILKSCARFPHKTAIIDSSCNDSSCDDNSCGRRITYSEYAELIQNLARGLVAASLKPGFLWRERTIRPEEVIVKKWRPEAAAPAGESSSH